MSQQRLKYLSWLSGATVSVLALSVWASQRFDGKPLSLYDIFPLLGLLAFSLMWTHYILGALRRSLGSDLQANKTYLKWTSVVVLLCILLHPGLLVFKLHQDGLGLPPNSYLQVYTESGMKLALMLGTISFIIFLLFELKSKFSKKLWWKYIDRAQILAMFLILYHGLTLGRELSVGWFKAVWLFYALTLVAATSYSYWYDSRATHNKEGK